MSESPLIKKDTVSSDSSELKLLKNEHLPVLEQLVDSSRKLNQAANQLIDRIQPASQTIPVFIAGTGAVGGTLIKLISELEITVDCNIKIVGACNSSHYIWNEQGLPPAELTKQIKKGEKTDWNLILNKLTNYAPGRLIFVDATGSEEVARRYPTILESSINIATPSKLANTFEQDFYEQLQQISRSQEVEFLYEPTVGAGLPILSTINGLLTTGDAIKEISGVASGTMTYLFNELEAGTPFSKAVKKARKLGYAEPDPRDDLSGEDVARKFLTLARTIGLKVERSELDIQTLVPEHLISVDKETFLDELSEVDKYWKSQIEEAKQRNETLRYVGKLTNHDISVGIESVPVDSPLGRLSGTDNLFQIFTKRYSNSPIVIQGPGAGKEVTAAGVLADILNIAKKIIVSKH
ncbi:hypothetical protein NC796_22120 [Aliifodinibius sp. S!AR15-10]|uniref:hypothetical protein n=1 Tax=Aliifodinibius sp. S!AR15-10 TaxID=2950437 RepID=UPI002857C7DF|nr:hypothetical protein [Aliifodinibius sp. S!AR15-10]MDR8393866.1 hypothetical protein [Aliifodinibius sp. S!AR15-10]